MSKYTTELRFICERAAGLDNSSGYADVNDIISKAIPKIFMFNFPIFDESYRNVLCTKILKHYYTREICEETVGLWMLRLDMRLNEIMPYFNQLYKSELLQFNPLYDVDMITESDTTKNETTDKTGSDNLDITEKETAVKDGTDKKTRNLTDTAKTTTTSDTTVTSSGSTLNEDTRRDLYSDTPQGSLQNVENETYLTNARKITDSKSEERKDVSDSVGGSDTDYSDEVAETTDDTFHESDTNNKTASHDRDIKEAVNVDGMEHYINKVKGKTGGVSYSKMLQEFRNTFLNIDMQVIDSLADLFINIW